LPALYVLARETFRDKPLIARIAVMLIALTPDVTNWASSGYVDLPMALYYVTGAAFTGAALRDQRTIDMALAGMCFGLAAWTKNAALLSIALLGTVILSNLINRQLRLNHVAVVLGCVAIVVAPWYLRNLALAGALTPDTVWTEDAQQTLEEILILVMRPQNYGLPGFVMLAGVFWSVFRREGWILLWWSVPYYGLWLMFASYDPRFVLLFLPFLAVLGAGMLASIWVRMGRWQPPMRLVVLIVVALLSVSVMWNSVDYKRALLENQVLTHEEKLEVVR
jgi:hypothetical protein